jgi:hypothetical protein
LLRATICGVLDQVDTRHAISGSRPCANVLLGCKHAGRPCVLDDARRRGGNCHCLCRLRNACRRRRNIPNPASARLDRCRVSVGNPCSPTASTKRAALGAVGVAFTRRPPCTGVRSRPSYTSDSTRQSEYSVAAGVHTADRAGRDHGHHQTDARRFECQDASRCTALRTRDNRQIDGTRQRC